MSKPLSLPFDPIARADELWRQRWGAVPAMSAITSIMRATDAFLFGIVLVIFAYAVALGFVFDATTKQMERLPPWMRVSTVSELRDALVEVILVYLLVDFATDWPQTEGDLSWVILAKPLSILAIAAAFSLFASRPPPTEPPQ